MGEGTFGQVLECWDGERKEMVAIKIVRGVKKYRDAAMIEVDALQQLGKHDKGGNQNDTRTFQFWVRDRLNEPAVQLPTSLLLVIYFPYQKKHVLLADINKKS